jgi:chromosome segregation ATPase
VVKSEDMEKIQDDPKLAEIRNQWFYTSQDRSNCATPVIPLQAASGQRIGSSSSSTNQASESSTVDKLAEKLEKLTSIVESSAEQIHALSVAQSAGLQRMQQINESNSTQINAIAESQAKLQALVDQNASHYIALTNTSFQSQDKMREVLQTTAAQIQSLSETQSQLAQTCQGMIRTMETHSASIAQLDSNASDMQPTHSTQSTQPCHMCNSMSSRINPPPRKLNRRIKGVWYEYDNGLGGNLPESPESPKRTVTNAADAPPKIPSTPRKLKAIK